MQNAIELQNVCKRYSDFYLDNLSLQLPVGQVMGLVGGEWCWQIYHLAFADGINSGG